jgi:hypothetical protein
VIFLIFRTLSIQSSSQRVLKPPSAGVKRPQREADFLSPSSGKFEKTGASLVRINYIHRDRLDFFYFSKNIHTGTFSVRGNAHAFIKKYEFQGGKIIEVIHGNRFAVIFRLVFLKDVFRPVSLENWNCMYEYFR